MNKKELKDRLGEIKYGKDVYWTLKSIQAILLCFGALFILAYLLYHFPI